MAVVIFMRHGQTQYNVEERLTGRSSDPELTENGVSQAEKVGKILYEHHIESIDYIVSSNMTRTNQTSAIVNKLLNKPMFFDADLQEVDRGGLEGQFLKDALPIIYDLEDHKPHPIHGGESTNEFQQRVVKGACKYLHSSEEKILLVSHGFSGAMITKTLIEEEIHLSNSEIVILDPNKIPDFLGKCGAPSDNICSADNCMDHS